MVIRKGVCLKLAGRIVRIQRYSLILFGVRTKIRGKPKTNKNKTEKKDRKKKKMDLIMNKVKMIKGMRDHICHLHITGEYM